MEIITLILGILIGSVTAYLILKNRYADSVRVNTEKENMLLSNIDELKEKLNDKEKLLFDLNGEYNAKQAEYRALEEKLMNHKKEIEDLQARFTIEFKNLANEILEEKSKRFTEQNKIKTFGILSSTRAAERNAIRF